MSEDAVLYASADGVGEITLNRPGNRNSMTEDVLEGLQAAIEKLRADGDLRCVIITGRGRSFCAGADFKSGAQRGGEGLAPHERSMAMYEPFLGVLEIEVPVIAAMQGHAVGGGLGLAIVCDLRVANESARYGANFTRLGLHPGMATTYILPRLVGLPRAAEWLFTGRLMSGAEAAEAGLANYACSGPDAVLEKARELAREIASAAPLAVRWTKKSLYRGIDWDPRSAAEFEAHAQSRTLETSDAKEGIAALLEKRDPVFQGR
ncbi:MAG: enoyl-CoA hydratase/isomerase family protein [Myxococcota bacterium]